MKRIAWTAALCVLALAPAVGQQKETAAPTIKRRAELVLVPTIVTQGGKPVRGLTAKDFVLLHNNQPENVDLLEEIDATPAKVEPASLPPRTAQNFAASDSRQEVVILLLDLLNSSWLSRATIHSYADDLLRLLARSRTPVSVFILSPCGLTQVHSFTSDPANLTKAIARWQSGMPAVPESVANWASPFAPTGDDQTTAGLNALDDSRDYPSERAMSRTGSTVEAIQQISEAFRGIPGRKKMIWMSIGFPQAPADASWKRTVARAAMDSKIEDKFELAWKSLSNANIAVYPVDCNGVVNPVWESHFSPEHSGSDSFMAPVSMLVSTNTGSLLQVAQKTGGRNCTSLPTGCLKRALADGTHYYMLGFYLRGDNKPGWHKLKVRVIPPRTSVRSRNGFLVTAERAPFPVKESSEILTALVSPLDYTAVPLRLSWSPLSKQDKGTVVELALSSVRGGVSMNPEDSTINADYLVFIRRVGEIEGRTLPASLATKLSPAEQKLFAEGGLRFRRRVLLPSGRYEVRVLLRDNLARKMGTVSTLIDLSPTAAPASGTPKP